MNRFRRNAAKPFVIGISGSVGSGKTTLIAKLSRRLGDCPTLLFDHYQPYSVWPQDFEQWIKDDLDPNQVSVPRLAQDLLSLLNGKPITYPIEDEIKYSASFILLEEPFGRLRAEIGGYIDLLVYVDTPQDVCVVRVCQRALEIESLDTPETFDEATKQDLVQRMNATTQWLSHYLWFRPVFIGVSRLVKAEADLIVDGMKTADDLVGDLLSVIEGLRTGEM